MELSFIYITTADTGEASAIGRALVEERLAACCNILDPMRSIYRWEGEIRDDTETVLIAKTRKSLVDKLIKRVRELHSYSCPCIISLPVTQGNSDYMEWIERETDSASRR